MQDLSVGDFPFLDFGDKRRGRRMVHIINDLCAHPEASIPVRSKGWYPTKATYKFFAAEAVSTEALEKAISAHGVAQLAGANKLFVAHDITVLSYQHSQVSGLGHTGNRKGKGILCFSSLAINEAGTPLGLLYQHTWCRKDLGKAKQRKELPFEQKESYNWHKAITQVDELLDASLQRIHLADREADIYELFCMQRPAGSAFLIRATHNRALEQGGVLWQHVGEQPAVATVMLEVPQDKGRTSRPIEAEVRFMKVSIRRPKTSKNECRAVEVTAIEVVQVSEKLQGQKQHIHWKLLTSLEVAGVEQALQCVRWYCYRWLIERFHYVLKSSTRIEALQLGQAVSLRKATHVYSLAAVRIMQLVYEGRQSPTESCEQVLSKEQWVVLYMLVHNNKQLPQHTPTLQEATYWIGRLGGHLGRKQDGPPGLKVVWTGYKRLCDAVDLYKVINPSP